MTAAAPQTDLFCTPIGSCHYQRDHLESKPPAKNLSGSDGEAKLRHHQQPLKTHPMNRNWSSPMILSPILMFPFWCAHLLHNHLYAHTGWIQILAICSLSAKSKPAPARPWNLSDQLEMSERERVNHIQHPQIFESESHRTSANIFCSRAITHCGAIIFFRIRNHPNES